MSATNVGGMTAGEILSEGIGGKWNDSISTATDTKSIENSSSASAQD